MRKFILFDLRVRKKIFVDGLDFWFLGKSKIWEKNFFCRKMEIFAVRWIFCRKMDLFER